MTVADNRLTALGLKPDETFVLDSRNTEFISGTVTTPCFRPTLRDILWPELLWLVFALVGSILLLYFQLLPVFIAHTGISTDGKLVSFDSHSTSKRGTVYDAQFTYTVANTTYTVTEEVDPQAFRTEYPANYLVLTIKYLTYAPDQATIVDPTRGDALNSVSVYELLLGLLMVILMAWVVNGMFREWQLRRRRVAAWHSAALVTGKVMACTSAEKQGRYRRWYEIKLTYQFLMPITGESVEATETRTRNDLRTQILPQPGTPVAVTVYAEPIALLKPLGRTQSYGFVL